MAEWLLYMASKEVDAFNPQITADICIYWSNVSKVVDVTDCKMFPHLSLLAKASHNFTWKFCGRARVLCQHIFDCMVVLLLFQLHEV